MQKSFLSKVALAVLVMASTSAHAGVVSRVAKTGFGATKAFVGGYYAILSGKNIYSSFTKTYVADVTNEAKEFKFDSVCGVQNRYALTAFEVAKVLVFASTAVSGVSDIAAAVLEDDAELDEEATN